VSIYATWLTLDDDHNDTCAVWREVTKAEYEASRTDPNVDIWHWITDAGDHYQMRDPAKRCDCGGNEPPLIYRGSHVNPADDDPRGGFVMVCVIPDYCHPDTYVQQDGRTVHDETKAKPVEYLRLSVREHETTYGRPTDNKKTVERVATAIAPAAFTDSPPGSVDRPPTSAPLHLSQDGWRERACAAIEAMYYEPGDATVILDRHQVSELHETLNNWLKAKERE
jgi:hypothetical protein